jgi:hypothetical protein
MRSMRIPVRAVGRSIGSRFNRQEIFIEIGLMCQIQALLADIEHFVFGAFKSSQIEFDRYRFLLNKTQRALQLNHLATALIQTVISISFKHCISRIAFSGISSPPAVKIVLHPEHIEHPAHQHIHQFAQALRL